MTERSFRFLAAVLLVAAVAASAGIGVRNGFINFDDPSMIEGNPRLEDPDVVDVVEVFTEVRDHAYLPVATLALMPDASFGNGRPAAYHLGSILWHLLNAYLVLALLRRLAGDRFVALAGALLFAVHPVAVESVAWASGRKDQVSLALLLLGLLAWRRWLECGGAFRFLGTTLLFLLSTFAKGSTVVFPLLAALVVLLWRSAGGIPAGRRVASALGVLAAAALVPITVHLAVARAEGTASAGATHTAAEGVFHGFDALAGYARHLVFPVGLSIHYPPGDPATIPWAGILVFGVLAVLAVRFLRAGVRGAADPRAAPAPPRPAVLASFAAAALLASLLPFNNVFPRTSVTLADRYLAVGLPFFALLAATGLARLPGRTRVLVVGLVVALLAGLALLRTREFQDGETVFRAAHRVEPNDPLPPAQIAEAILAKQELPARARNEQALEWFARSLGLAEQDGNEVRILRARIRYADTLLRAARFAPAEEHFRRALAEVDRDPERFRALGVERGVLRHNLAQACLGLGRVADARDLLASVLADDPKEVATRLSVAELDLRDAFVTLAEAKTDEMRDRARHLANRALTGLRELLAEFDAGRSASPRVEPPEHLEVRARTALARALLRAPWQSAPLVEAHAQMSLLVDHFPKRPEGLLLRAALKDETGDRPGALLDSLRALALDPADLPLRLEIARRLREVGENRRAVELLRAAPSSPEGDPLVRRELSSLYVAQAVSHRNARDFDKALAAALEARTIDPGDPDAWVQEGETEEARRNLLAAERAYRRALEIEAENDAARRGLARFHQARAISALSELKQRVRAAPAAEQAEVERNLRDLVMADFRRALELAPGSGEVALARRHLRDAPPGEKRAVADDLVRRARAELLQGHPTAALELLAQATRVDGTSPDAQLATGEAKLAARDVPGAIESLERVLALDPEHLPALLVLVRLYHAEGRNSAVRRAGETVRRLAEDPEIRAAFKDELADVERVLADAKDREAGEGAR